MFQLRTFAALFLLAGSLGAAPGGCGPEPEPSRRGASTQKAEKPSKPQDPEQPIDPINLQPPVGPNDPVDPIEPTDPVNPVDPVDPTDPIEPVDPVDPVVPADPIEPVDPVDPVVPADPIEPVDPVDPIEPVDPVAPVTPADPCRIDADFAHKWLQVGQRKFYDQGGSSVVITTRMALTLNADGTYEFSSTRGQWCVADITAADWTNWQLESYEPYFPTRKLVLKGNNGFVGVGPVDETTTTIDKLWTSYRDESETPGTVWMSFGVSNSDEPIIDEPVEPTLDQTLVGQYINNSDKLFYDDGSPSGWGSTGSSLNLYANGTWEFAGTHGRWEIAPITDADWQAWEIGAYGPTRKIVVYGFRGETSQGPITESDGGVEDLWLVFRDDLNGREGTRWMQFIPTF